MNVIIEIYYLATEVNIKGLRRGSFPLKKRKPEEVALTWWKKIQRESFVDLELEKVIVDEVDITELVKELEKALLD